MEFLTNRFKMRKQNFALLITVLACTNVFAQSSILQGDEILTYSRGGDYRLNEGSLGSYITSSFVVLGPGFDVSDAYVTYGFTTTTNPLELRLDFRAGTDEGSGTLKLGFYNYDTESFDYETMNNSDYAKDVAYTFNDVISTSSTSQYVDENGRMEVQFISSDGWYIDYVRMEWVEPNLIVDPDEFELYSISQNVTFDIESNIDWNVIDDQSWISVTQSSGNSDKTISVAVQKNDTGSDRFGTITVSGNGLTEEVSIAQFKEIELEISPEELVFLGVKENDTFTIESNVDWDVEDDTDWISVAPSSGSDDKTITVIVQDNSTGSIRTGTVTIKAERFGEEKIKKVEIIQYEEIYIDADPEELIFNGGKGSASFVLESNISWDVEDDSDWISVAPSSGSDDKTITVTVQDNNTDSDRFGEITIEGEKYGQQRIEDVQIIQRKQIYLDLDDEEFQFDEEGGNETFEIESNTDWIVSVDSDWVSITPLSGNSDKTIDVVVEGNNTGLSRSGLITVKAERFGEVLEETISITQLAKIYLNTNIEELNFDGQGENKTFTISSNTDWVITSDTDWLSVNPSKGKGDSLITVSVEANNADSVLFGNIMIKYSEKELLIKVVVGIITSTELELVVDEFALYQNYPNPFNPSTSIQFSLPQASEVTLKVFDVTGREIVDLVSGRISAGQHSVTFNASRLSSGVYIYRLEAGEFIQTKRMLLIK